MPASRANAARAHARLLGSAHHREIADASGETVSGKVNTLLFVLGPRLEGSLSAERQQQPARAVVGLQAVIDDGVASPGPAELWPPSAVGVVAAPRRG